MKPYGQYCGLARAAELLGERWTLLIVRDLLVGPQRFNDLRHGIPGIPSNVLTGRLRDLEDAGVVERALRGRSVDYRLTDYGRDLGPVIVSLGRWGARQLDAPRPAEAPTESSLAAALQSARTPARVVPFTVEVSAGPVAAHADVEAEGLAVGRGPLPDADLRLGGPGLRRLLADGDAAAAVASGLLLVEGDATLLDRFTRAFRVPLDDPS